MRTKSFIGDVHGKYARYKNILARASGTIQVGDMGLGFRRSQGQRAGEFVTNPPHYAMLASNARFIRGNHDNPGVCKTHSQWIPDGHVEDGMMFVGGGVSVDRAFRIKDYSWWEDEELSLSELENIIKVYETEKPRVMVTHDCPEGVAVEIARTCLRIEKLDSEHASRSRQAFQQMWQMHAPKLWVFGHWHHSFDHVLNGTRFVCLAELEVRELEV